MSTLLEAEAAEAAPIVFRHHVPQPPLSEFVALFWYWRGHQAPWSRERILPMGTTEFVFKLESSEREAGGISGPHTESMIIERRAEDALLGIHFHPGGAFPFLKFPAGELHGVDASLHEIWGAQDAEELSCRLGDAPTIERKFQVLEHWLMKRARHPLRHHPAVRFALKEFGRDPAAMSGAAMAERIGLSQRRFIQVFRDQVGLTPKLFCRLVRFQQVIESLQNGRDPDWVDIALSCGYFDQSHFNHEFREFSGLSPSEYLSLRTSHTNHVPVRD